MAPSNYLHCQNKLLAQTGHVSTRHESKVIWIFLNFYPLPISIFFYPKCESVSFLSWKQRSVFIQFYTETWSQLFGWISGGFSGISRRQWREHATTRFDHKAQHRTQACRGWTALGSNGLGFSPAEKSTVPTMRPLAQMHVIAQSRPIIRQAPHIWLQVQLPSSVAASG